MRFFLRMFICLLFGILTNSAFSQSQNSGCPLVNKSIAVAGGSISYLEGGHGKPILLLHGLFAQKEQWLEVGCAIASEGFDVIIPDLPGYGASNGYSVSVYPLDVQVQVLHELIMQLGKGRIHIAGSSMGGTIAALFANKYPREVETLAFIGAPLGIVGWSPQVKQAIFQGVNPFIPINEKQFDLEMHLLFYKPPAVDENVKAKLVQEYVENNRHYQQVWDIVNFYDQSLDNMATNSSRTLVLWGEQDGIFSVDGLRNIKKTFKNAQIVRFPDAAHLLMLEQPKQVVNVYSKFLRE